MRRRRAVVLNLPLQTFYHPPFIIIYLFKQEKSLLVLCISKNSCSRIHSVVISNYTVTETNTTNTYYLHNKNPSYKQLIHRIKLWVKPPKGWICEQLFQVRKSITFEPIGFELTAANNGFFGRPFKVTVKVSLIIEYQQVFF